MRLKLAAVVLCAAGAVLWAAPARAEIELQSVRWQQMSREKGQAAKPLDIKALSVKEGGPLGGRLLAKVKLLNRGAAVEGILLRYAVTAKIARIADPKRPAEWAVPYTIDQTRVPKVGANQFLEASLDPTALTELYLRKIYSQGYWPVELKLQVMLEPRKDNTGALQVLESSLPLGQ